MNTRFLPLQTSAVTTGVLALTDAPPALWALSLLMTAAAIVFAVRARA